MRTTLAIFAIIAALAADARPSVSPNLSEYKERNCYRFYALIRPALFSLFYPLLQPK
jgi:hypothetical protein